MAVSAIQEELRSKGEDLKLRAVSSEFRRLLLGLIYTKGPIYQSDLLKHVEVDSNALAYHLNKLYEADLVERTFNRQGKNFVKYSIKRDGERFLEFIGAKEKLDKIAKKEGK